VFDGLGVGTGIALGMTALVAPAELLWNVLRGIKQHEAENTLPDHDNLRWDLKRGRRA